MSKPKTKNQSDTDQNTSDKDGYNTPIDGAQRHTGMYEKGDGKQDAQPEGGSGNTGPEGAPNQGIEKR